MDNATIRIEQQDGICFGTILDSDKPENINKQVLKDFRYHQEEKNWKGEIYSPERNMTISATITLEEKQNLKWLEKNLSSPKLFIS